MSELTSSLRRAGLLLLATAASVGLALSSGTTASADPASDAWFTDRVSPEVRAGEVRVPARPQAYRGPRVRTKANFRTARGALALPLRAARGHRLEAGQALSLSGASLYRYEAPRPTRAARRQVVRLRASLVDVRAVTCEGYADYAGRARTNKRVARLRARQICRLVRRVAPHVDTKTVSYGGRRPAVLGSTSPRRAPNRRVVIVVDRAVPALARLEDRDAAANLVPEGAAAGSPTGLTVRAASARKVTYRITRDSTGGGFAVDAATGVVRVADPARLDHETGPLATLVIQATDGTTTRTAEFRIAVADVAPSEPVDVDDADDVVVEGADAGTEVGITASSTDPNGPAVTYAIAQDTSDGGFAVDPETGVVTVADGSKIDHESATGAAYDVTVRATAGGLSGSRTFSVAVTDVAPSTPVDTDDADDAVAEGAAAGTPVGITVSSADVNGPAAAYAITHDTSDGGFAVDAETGVVTVADASRLDHESTVGHAHEVTVRATAGGLSTSETFTVAITDVAPSTPVDADEAANAVAESADAGTPVGLTAAATEPNGPAVSYKIVDDSSEGGFGVDAETGVVTVADGSKLDHETADGHAHEVTVRATAGALSTSETFTVAITDVAPSTPVDADEAANTVAEGADAGTTVGLTASSADVNGPAVSYEIADDTSEGGFAVDAETGVVTVADGALLDFETADGHAHDVTVRATAGGLSSSETFAIAVTDVAPSTPVDADEAANAVAEGAAAGTAVGVTVSSTDVNGPAVSYEIADDTSEGGFAVDAETGVVTVADGALLDHESASGHAHDVTVRATAGALSRSHTFTIAVTDVAPSTPVDADDAENTVAEGAAAGTLVGLTASSTDVNGPAVSYQIVDDSSEGGFDVDAETGVVSVADGSQLDFESAPGHAYDVTVRASAGGLSASQTFSIDVTDVAPTTPVDTDADDNAVAEGADPGTTVGVTASSTEPNGPAVTYELTSDSSDGGFTVDADTGVVTVLDGSRLDFGTAPDQAYTITVRATAGALSSSADFTIAVTDRRPTRPEDTDPAENAVAEGAAAGTAVGLTVSSTSPDGSAITYELTDDTSDGGFEIDADSGVVTVADGSQLDHETAADHDVTVRATAGDVFSSRTFTVAVSDVAPSVPVDADAAPNRVAEGAAAGTLVGLTASSTDPNGPDVTYELTSDSSDGGFEIDAETGVVSVADGAQLDFESAPGHAYEVTVEATAGALSRSHAFTIAVADVVPSTPIDADEAENTVAEGAAAGTSVGITASSTDVNGPGVSYTIVDDSSEGGFDVDAETGVVSVADGAQLDFESAPGHAYDVTVEASAGALASSETFAVAVTDVAPTTPVDTDTAADTVAEGADAGTPVGITASSTDLNGPAVTYALTSDTSDGGFAIDAGTGVVSVADPLKVDFETSPGHAYDVTVRASAGSLSSSADFTIAVTDEVPTAPVDADPAANQVPEGAPAGTTVGLTARSTDGGSTVAYELTGDTSGGGFEIDPDSGVVTVADGSVLDFETGAAHEVEVTATDGGGTATRAFTVGITDVAPTAPVDTDVAADEVVEGAAAGTAVGVTASSTDPNGPDVTYAVTEDTSEGGFTVDADTGVVTVADGSRIDFETAAGHRYEVTVQASTAAGVLPGSTTFPIAVSNLAPSTPTDDDPAPNTVVNGAAVGTPVGLTAAATDPNGPDVSYAIVDDTSSGGFGIDPATGVVSVADSARIVHATAPGHAYEVTVEASDGFATSSASFTIDVTQAVTIACPTDIQSAFLAPVAVQVPVTGNRGTFTYSGQLGIDAPASSRPAGADAEYNYEVTGATLTMNTGATYVGAGLGSGTGTFGTPHALAGTQTFGNVVMPSGTYIQSSNPVRPTTMSATIDVTVTAGSLGRTCGITVDWTLDQWGVGVVSPTFLGGNGTVNYTTPSGGGET